MLKITKLFHPFETAFFIKLANLKNYYNDL